VRWAWPLRLVVDAARWTWGFFRPRRTIWPTRDGWWTLFAAMGLGVAAINTGNNLLYLLASMLLGLVVVSGILSEMVMRGLRAGAARAEEIFAGRPALVGAVVSNRKRLLPSYSVTLEILAPAGAGARRVDRVAYLPRLGAGEDRLVAWEVTLPRRGRHTLPGIRFTSYFPFGIFLKAGRVQLDEAVVVYPAVGPAPAHLLRELGGTGAVSARRKGRGHDLHNLRDYQPGDDPRLIHWRTTARAQSLTVRELEAETTLDTRIVLTGGARAGAALETGLSEAASLAMHLLREGAAVELAGPGLAVPAGRGSAQTRRILTALALFEPPPPARPGPRSGGGALGGSGAPLTPQTKDMREIRVAIG
jgi:uncharacterized protein (DUF58 family)